MDLIKILPYTMENKILKEQLLVVAPSFLDELGHFEYINEKGNPKAVQRICNRSRKNSQNRNFYLITYYFNCCMIKFPTPQPSP